MRAEALTNELHEVQEWDAYFAKGSAELTFFENHAGWYDCAYQDFACYIGNHHYGRKLRVLEVGAGSGKMSYAISPLIKSLTLVDLSKNALCYAVACMPQALRGLRLKLLLMWLKIASSHLNLNLVQASQNLM